MNKDGVSTWVSERRVFPPFKCLSVVDYPAGSGDCRIHSHEYLQGVLLLSGRFEFNASTGGLLELMPGDLALIPKGLSHGWRAPVRCKALQLAIEPMLPEDYGDLSSLFGARRPSWTKVRLPKDSFKKLSGRILDEMAGKEAGGASLIHAFLLELAALALRFCSVGNGEIQDAGKALEGEEAFAKALDFIHANYRRDVSLEELAANSFLGVSRFSEIFRKRSGQAPMKYFAAYRMERAKALLSYSEMSVSEVARHLGFDSIHYFSKAFRKQHGEAPSSVKRFRKN